MRAPPAPPAPGAPTAAADFDVRGRAEVVRLALHDYGVAFEDQGFSGEAWGKGKPDGLKAEMMAAGKLAFGQVPLLTVTRGPTLLAMQPRTTYIVQSHAILRFLGREFGFYDDEWGAELLAAVDLAADGTEDVRSQLMKIKYGGGDDAAKEELYAQYFDSETGAAMWLGL